jgi:hypothetical protein
MGMPLSVLGIVVAPIAIQYVSINDGSVRIAEVTTRLASAH